ncbi:radical SAM protein [Pedobacter sp. NJ-S-72]
MAGIYIHIPFCKQACNYCDFHFSTSLQHVDEMTDAICKEILLKKSRISDQQIGSIYFGGGTPSLLPEKSLAKIFDTLTSNFSISVMLKSRLKPILTIWMRTKSHNCASFLSTVSALVYSLFLMMTWSG